MLKIKNLNLKSYLLDQSSIQNMKTYILPIKYIHLESKTIKSNVSSFSQQCKIHSSVVSFKADKKL